MLILSRRLNESIVIDDRIIVKITCIDRDAVKLGIEAPAALQVHRKEIYESSRKRKDPSLSPPTTPKSGPPAPCPSK
jgi:carbon storage regulator